MNSWYYFYYYLKSFIPRSLQIVLRRRLAQRQLSKFGDVWPINEQAKTPPEGWSGWPGKKRFSLALTHDVETARGLEKLDQLMKLETGLGFRSCFSFVPKQYKLLPGLVPFLRQNDFDVGVHGLKHDGKLFLSKRIFRERAVIINQYLKKWNSVGFSSPAMHHNLNWIEWLNIEYDLSTFDTDPFEPQPDGVTTIFPFRVDGNSTGNGIVELPYTLPQDFSLFVIMKETNIEIWKRKVDWIAENGGMALLNTHPDYMNFDDATPGLEEYPAPYYAEFLEYLRHKYAGQYWHVLPREIARFWSQSYPDHQA